VRRRRGIANLFAMAATIVVLHGDQTGEELLQESLRVMDAALGDAITLQSFDLSLRNRRETKNAVVTQAAEAMLQAGFGLKAATITPEHPHDVGSPNALLRERVGGKVILRTGRRIPGVAGAAGVSAPISVVRMAVDDAYNAREWRETNDGDELAFRTERISRATCRAVAEFAFRQAERTHSRVFGGPKFTVSPTYEGMFKEEMDAAAARHPAVSYEPQLIDATYALLLSRAADPLVIPALNRDGDCLSDLVLQFFGSIAGSESLLFGFEDDSLAPAVVMAEAPHGTAPALEGKNIANPMAMILAAASLLGFMPDAGCRAASRTMYESVFETVRGGLRTADLGGHALTDDFTDAVINATTNKLETWGSLGVTS
jgi:isocitrate/isopropylmalate dehydrogenase